MRHRPRIHLSRCISREAWPGRAAAGASTLPGQKPLPARGDLSADPKEDEEPQKEGSVLADVAGNASWFSLDAKGIWRGQERALQQPLWGAGQREIGQSCHRRRVLLGTRAERCFLVAGQRGRRDVGPPGSPGPTHHWHGEGLPGWLAELTAVPITHALGSLKKAMCFKHSRAGDW